MLSLCSCVNWKLFNCKLIKTVNLTSEADLIEEESKARN